jgi:hypothetical protein
MSAAICKYFISATLLDVSNMLEDTDIVEAIPSKFAFKNEVAGDDRVYHSLHRCIRYDIDIPKKNTTGGLECAMKCVGQALKDKLYVEYNNRGLPYLICQFHTEQVKPNEEIAKAMSASKVEGVDIAGITFDAKGATVYENGKVSKKFSRLNESIQYLKDKNAPVIHMMAGALCNRAFRVTSVDYEVYIGLGIYGYNNDQEASTAVQKLGRMCGLTPKRLMCAQRVFCDQKVFYKAVDCTNITSSFVQTAVDNPDEKFADMKGMVVIPARKSRKKLSVNGIESIFKVDKKIESVHGKLREEEEELVEEVKEEDEKSGDEDSQHSNDPTLAWLCSNLVINQTYTGTQVRDMVKMKMGDNIIFPFSLQGERVQFVKQPKNGTYQVDESVIVVSQPGGKNKQLNFKRTK